MAELKTGDKAPEFALPASDGKIYSLKEFLDKKVVLYFIPKMIHPAARKKHVHSARMFLQ